jgi:hypothetical protein
VADVVSLELSINPKSLAKFEADTKGVTERALAITIEGALDRIEKATLIKDYTQNSKPSKPEGSTYRRTFRLQDSSRKEMTSKKLPKISGRWEARIKYASQVIGPIAEQSEIHKGRWPALELAINNVNTTIADDFDKAMKKVQK